MHDPALIAFVLYLGVILIVGLAAYRLTRDLADFVLGGRRLGAFVTALSTGASGMSGWLLLGLPGAFYLLGLDQIWMAIGLTLGAYLNWTIVCPRLRRFTELAGNALTLPDYFEQRFDDRSRLLRIVCALVILFFFTVYTASGLVAGALLFSNAFGLGYETALHLGALMVVSYTFVGGFLAVSWTDVIQGLLMLIALIVVPVAAVQSLGGWAQTVAAVVAVNPAHVSVFDDLGWLGIASLLAWGLGYFGQPHLLARFMAMRSADEMPHARAIGMSWMILCLYGALASGFTAVGYYAEVPLTNAETAFIALAEALFNPWVAGIILAAVLAAIMSTADSQLIVASSALTEDFYRGFLRPDAGDRELLWIGRSGVIIIAVVALTLARDPGSRVLDIVAYAWAGFGAGFGPAVLLSVTWPRMTAHGALAGIVTGSVTVAVWSQLDGGLFDVYEILPGCLFAAVSIVVVSLLQAPPAAAKRFFADIGAPQGDTS